MLERLKDAPDIIKLIETIYLDTSYSHALIFKTYTPGNKFTPTSSDELRDFMMQVLQAVAQCHAKGIIHHDIKPDNLLYLRAEVKLDVKLCDFGLAINEEDVFTWDFEGTKGYISPDQIYEGKVSKATDVWAVGMVFASLILDGFVPTEYVQKSGWCFVYESELASLAQKKKLTPHAEDLLVRMLKMNSDERISAEEALKHMYFTAK